MRPFEYALGLLTILVSLALADIVLSFHRLMRHARTVRWDGRVLIAAALVILEIIRLWFAQWSIRDVAVGQTFPIYLAQFVQILLLVLLAASSLPDEAEVHCDLHAFYDSNRRYFWGVFALYQLIYFLLWLTVFGGDSGPSSPINWLRVLTPVVLYLLLSITRRPWLDYAVPALLIAFYLWRYWGQTLA
ncbi:MAG TPA: hypothetical protein VGH02_15495 [Rhizomicrobium sp.]|jgi:hypothetical protein